MLHSSLYLVYSTGHSLYPNICADSLRHLILQCSLSIILTSSFKGRWLPLFPSVIYGLLYLLFDVLLAFLLVGSMACLCILYHNYKGWSTHSSWSCWILLVAWHGRDKPLVNIILMSYGLHIFWILSPRPLT